MKYLRIFAAFFKASAISDLEYRLNVVMKVFTDLCWYAAQLSVFEVLFLNVNQVSGWTLEITRVFMAMLFLVDALWMLFFSENLDKLSERVRKGELDLLLAKPINSQFMLSFQRVSTAYVFNVAFTIGYLVWSLQSLPFEIAWYRLIYLAVLVPASLTLTYSLRFFFSATALIFARADNINYVWYNIYRLGMRPEVMYPSWLRYVVLTIVPMGFLASVPTRIVLGMAEPWMIGIEILIAGFVLYMSTRFWDFALRSYASASS